MAGLTRRWSRAEARTRWTELGDLVRVPLTAGVAFTAIWPLTALVVHWSDYRDPRVAAAILVVAVATPLALCWLGPRGIGPVASGLVGTSSILLTLLLGLQLDGHDPGGQHWMNSWGAAVAIVLAFARPVEEPIAIMAGVLTASFAVKPVAAGDLQALHIAPLTIGAAFPATVSAIALAAMTRASVRAARRTRAAAEASEQKRAVADAVHQERQQRFARWEPAVAPLLEDIASGRLDPADPAVAQTCRELAQRLRAELSASPESLFEVLLAPEIARVERCGGSLVVQDLDVGYRLHEQDRVRLMELVGEVCTVQVPATIQLTLLDNGSDPDALAILAVDGLPVPDGPGWAAAVRMAGATLTAESPTRWWWDTVMRCNPAPAIGIDGLQMRGR